MCLIAALPMGIPLTLVLTPLVYGATMIVAEIIDYFSPLNFWQNVNAFGQL